jgi:hypothetical protein
MINNSGYKVNEDGSVTKINSADSNGSNHSNGSSNNNNNNNNNNGCTWLIIIAVAIGIIIAIASSNSDSNSDSNSNNDSYVDSIAVVEEIVEEDPLSTSATYLSVSDDEIVMGPDGGNEEITVYTDGEWYIDVNVDNWGQLTRYSDSVVLHLDKNTSRSTRTDYFILKSDSYSKRINITQYGNTDPSAEIENIWMEHSIYQNGQKGMKIHVKFTVDNMNGKTIYVYAFFYWGDNTTPLHDAYGDNLSFKGYGSPNYDGCRFEDFTIFVPYDGLNMQAGQGSVNISFDISIRTSSGTELTRKNNTQLTYTN